jgi:hypothetical protein
MYELCDSAADRSRMFDQRFDRDRRQICHLLRTDVDFTRVFLGAYSNAIVKLLIFHHADYALTELRRTIDECDLDVAICITSTVKMWTKWVRQFVSDF